MLTTLLDPIILCFVAGLLAGILKSDLRIPEALYETLSIYLLLAIGLKGGIQLAQSELAQLLAPLTGTLFLGLLIPVIAFLILFRLARFGRSDAAAVAAHYGSVSAVTFAVCLAFLERLGSSYEEYVTVLLVTLEVPAIAVGIGLARWGQKGGLRWKALLHEIFLGKSVFLLLAGLIIGTMAGPDGSSKIAPVFLDLFYGVLALFLLEMGLLTSRRLGALRQTGAFLVAFGIIMPLVSASLGILVGLAAGMSPGGATVLGTLAGSASYIAAPAAMRIAVPEANPTLYLTASLGITFPFNLVAGIPLYFWIATLLDSWR